VLQQLNYLDFIDIYKDRIRMFHVKDAEFNPSGRQGIYGGYQSWETAPDASARWATARSTSRPSSPS
jgi:sugar phosphate isomerase/epimerase